MVAKLIVTDEELAILIKSVNVYRAVNPFTGFDIDTLLTELTDLKNQLDLIKESK